MGGRRAVRGRGRDELGGEGDEDEDEGVWDSLGGVGERDFVGIPCGMSDPVELKGSRDPTPE